MKRYVSEIAVSTAVYANGMGRVWMDSVIMKSRNTFIVNPIRKCGSILVKDD